MIVKVRLQGLDIVKIFVYRPYSKKYLTLVTCQILMCEERLQKLYDYQIFDDLLPFISFSLLLNSCLISQTMAFYGRKYKTYSIKSLK